MKDSQIRIRCSKETKKDFKKVALDFKNSEEAILAFVRTYKEKPWLFFETRLGEPRIR